MTEITIQVPSQILIEESQTLDRNRIPLIPATQIIGQLTPAQVPVGAIPGLENFEQLDSLLQQVSERVEQIEQADLITGSELDDALEPIGTEIAALQTGLTEKANQTEISPLALGLASLSASLTALQNAISGKADQNHSQPIASIIGLTTALNDLQTQINNLQQQDSDLAAIAALSTQPFGRSLLTLADLAAAKTLLEIPASGGSSQTASELTYTVSQSSIWPGSSALTLSVLTDGNINTGGGTNTGGANWIKADLGSAKTIERLTVAGGNPPNYSGAASALNNRSIQVSLDDVIWLPLFNVTDATNTGSTTFPTPTVKARYLRIFTSSGGVGTTELRIFGY